MAFKINRNADEIKDYQGGSGDFIGAKSGMFPVKIKHALMLDNGNGAQHVNLIVDYNGNETTIYRAFPLSNNGGGDNTIGQEMFNNLLIVLGVTGDEVDTVMKEIPLGKEGTLTEVPVFEDLEDLEVMLHIKRRFSWYEAKATVSQSTIIANTFRIEDNASAAEIVNNKEVGVQFEYESKTADKDRIDKGLTQEQVDEFLANRAKGGAKSDEAPAQKDNKPKTGFGSKFKN